MTIVCGLDEAGRGSVVGPLIIAAYAVDSREQGLLTELGAADSKTLTPKRREELYDALMSVCAGWRVVRLDASEVNGVLRRKGRSGLNMLEARSMAALINDLKPDIAIID